MICNLQVKSFLLQNYPIIMLCWIAKHWYLRHVIWWKKNGNDERNQQQQQHHIQNTSVIKLYIDILQLVQDCVKCYTVENTAVLHWAIDMVNL